MARKKHQAQSTSGKSNPGKYLGKFVCYKPLQGFSLAKNFTDQGKDSSFRPGDLQDSLSQKLILNHSPVPGTV